jgi:hypothetical protein
MKILRDPIGSCSFRHLPTGSDPRILRPVELNPVVIVKKRCISGTNRRENDVNMTDHYSAETAWNGAVFFRVKTSRNLGWRFTALKQVENGSRFSPFTVEIKPFYSRFRPYRAPILTVGMIELEYKEEVCEYCRKYYYDPDAKKIFRDASCVFSWGTQSVSWTTLKHDVNTVFDKSLGVRQKLSK